MAEVIEWTPSGLYCAAGDFFIDPHHPVRRALITHAHSDHARPGNQKYWTSRRGLELVKLRVGREALIQGVSYGEPLDFNGVQVSFHPAGHCLGSAQIRVEHRGEVWVFTGDYKRQVDPSCTPFEIVPCDTFITEATFALPIYRWPAGSEVAEEIWSWWAANAKDGHPSVLFAYAVGKAQRILAELTSYTERAVLVHGAVHTPTQQYCKAGIDMLPTFLWSRRPEGFSTQEALILAPPSAQKSTWMKRFKGARTAFASGWMNVRGIRRRRGYERGFILSDHVDWYDLIKTIRQTGASRVLATHGRTESLVRYLRENLGLDADPLKTRFSAEIESMETETPEDALSHPDT